MILATWRLQRLVVLVAAAIVGLFAIWLAVTGSMQADAWTTFIHSSGHGSCVVVAANSCAAASAHYYNLSHLSSVSYILLLVLPPLLGLVLGAPLIAREMEQRTNRVAWTQSMTRARWLVVKLGVGAAITCGLVAVLAPLAEWWTSATNRTPRIMPRTFDVAGVVPIAYALFAFVLGAALGAVIRRSAWAFAAGVPIYAGVRFLVSEYLRPGLATPSVVVANANGYALTGWQINGGYVPLGRTSPLPGQNWQSGEVRISNCVVSLGSESQPSSTNTWTACQDRLKLHWVVQYQPPQHFWQIQGIEAAVFCALAAALVGVTFLAVRWWRT